MGTKLYPQSYRRQHPYGDFAQLDEFLVGTYQRWSEVKNGPFGKVTTVQIRNLSPGGAGFVLHQATLPPQTHIRMSISEPDSADKITGIFLVRRVEPLRHGGLDIGVGLYQIESRMLEKLLDFINKLAAATSATFQ